jgi:hypothetical protein
MAASQYYIPRRTKVKTVFVKGLTSTDLIWLALCAVSAVVLFISGQIILQMVGGMIAILALAGMGKGSDGNRIYESFVWYFRFAAYSKKFAKKIEKGFMEMTKLVPYSGIADEKFINFDGYFAAVIEISPIEFGLLGNEAQTMLINAFGNAIRRVTVQQSGSIVSFEKPFVFDKYIDAEIAKYEQMVQNVKLGVLSDEELSTREIIFAERGAILEYMNEESKVYRTAYYLVIYGSKKEELDITANGIINSLAASLGGTKRVTGKDLYVFLRGNYDKFFNENDFEKISFEDRINWTMPDKVRFGVRKQIINGRPKTGVVITDFPIMTGNAWGYSLFNFEGSKTVLNFYQVSKTIAEKQIDKAIIEMRSQEGTGFKESQRIESQNQLQTIEN